MNLLTELIHAVKTPVSLGIGAGDMIAVVGKLFAGDKTRGFTNDLVPLDDQPGPVGVSYDPFSTQEGDCVFGPVLNCDKIDERMGFVGRQARAAPVIVEFVEAGGETWEFAGEAGHTLKRLGNAAWASAV